MANTNGNISPCIELEMIEYENDVAIRPVSFYDNKSLEEQPLNSLNNNEDIEEVTSRSQVNFMNTTVPQNIRTHDFVEKHTPTRNSLRHSRLITLNRNGTAYNDTSTVLIYQNLAKVLLVCILIIGLALCIESLWLLLWTPNLRLKDNPGWSGIPVLVSSFAGVLFVSGIPTGYSGRKFGYWRNFLKYISITISSIATATSILTVVFGLLHLFALYSMICVAIDALDTSCICKYNSTEENLVNQSYHYVDLTCAEVEHILTILIICTCVASSLVVIFELIYLFLHWKSRNVYEYARVPVNELNIHGARDR